MLAVVVWCRGGGATRDAPGVVRCQLLGDVGARRKGERRAVSAVAKRYCTCSWRWVQACVADAVSLSLLGWQMSLEERCVVVVVERARRSLPRCINKTSKQARQLWQVRPPASSGLPAPVAAGPNSILPYRSSADLAIFTGPECGAILVFVITFPSPPARRIACTALNSVIARSLSLCCVNPACDCAHSDDV